MLIADRTTLEDTPLHSHSEMTRQLEELEAHAQALRMAEEATPYVLADLITFADQFGAEMQAHIAEEEQEFFPTLRSRYTATHHKKLVEILQQHRDLEHSFQTFRDYLARAEKCTGELGADLIEAIFTRVRLLRYAFTIHCMEEEEFFCTLNGG
jgi:iron-sulfur cluster repair protein YtfE (RIC family)